MVHPSVAGASGPRLVVLKNQLTPGASYTFSLRATYGQRTATATSTVRMNRAPFGGAFSVEFTPPAVALTTTIVLQARYWVDDDPEDLPLKYSFAYRPRGTLRRLRLTRKCAGAGTWT